MMYVRKDQNWSCETGMNCHHHHVVPLARISLTLSRHFPLSFIASGRSSRLHPISSHCCWMYVRAGRPVFARPYVGVHSSTSLMRSSLLMLIFSKMAPFGFKVLTSVKIHLSKSRSPPFIYMEWSIIVTFILMFSTPLNLTD